MAKSKLVLTKDEETVEEAKIRLAEELAKRKAAGIQNR